MVSDPTLAVARTGQCAGIWCMACVGPDGTHGMAYGAGTRRADQCAGIWCMARVGPDGTHDMTYGAGTGRTGVRQEGAVLDICPCG